MPGSGVIDRLGAEEDLRHDKANAMAPFGMSRSGGRYGLPLVAPEDKEAVKPRSSTSSRAFGIFSTSGRQLPESTHVDHRTGSAVSASIRLIEEPVIFTRQSYCGCPAPRLERQRKYPAACHDGDNCLK